MSCLNLMSRECDSFSSLSKDLIKADMNKGLDLFKIKKRLKVFLASLNIRENKLEDLGKLIVKSANPLESWIAVLSELEILAELNAEEIIDKTLPPTPLLSQSNFLETEMRHMINGTTRQTWLELALTEVEFSPIFKYGTNPTQDDFIDFAEASAGQ